MNLVSSHSATTLAGVHRGTGPTSLVQNQPDPSAIARAADKLSASGKNAESDQKPARLEARELQLQTRLRMQQAREERLIADQIQTLATRDREVRAHEQAHVAAGGQYAGAPVYQFERGPNGVSYAVGGEVSISAGEEATPEATLRKAQIIRRAALAPAEPSPQDRGVAAMASRMEAAARSEIAADRTREEEDPQSVAAEDETAPAAAEKASSATPGNPDTHTSDRPTTFGRQQEDLARLQHKLFTRDKMASTPPGTLLSQMA